MLYLLLFFIPLIFNPWGANESYETAKQSWFLFVLALASAVALINLWRKKKYEIVWHRILLILSLLWLVSFAISTIFGRAPIESFWGSYDRRQGLLAMFFYAAHFWICLQLFRNKKFKNAFFAITLFIGSLIAVYGILQVFDLDPLRSDIKDMFTGRAFATMGSPVFLGQFLIFPWMISFVWFFSKKRIWLHTFLLALFSAALYFTYNRASILGLGFAVILFFVSKAAWTKVRAALATVFLLLFLLGGFLWLGFNKDSTRLLSTRSLGSRAVLWEAAAKVIPANFWLGSGPEETYQQIQKTISPRLYFYERMLDIPDRVHNVFLETFVTRGAAGFLILFGTVLWMITLALQKKLKTQAAKTSFFAIAAYFVSIQFSFSLITHAIFLLAFAALLFSELLKFKTVRFHMSFVSKTASALILLFVIFIFSNLSYRITKTELLLHRAVPAFLLQKPEALSLFQEAHNELPYFREIPYMTFSLFYDDARKDEKILQALQGAAKDMSEITHESFYANLMRAHLATRREVAETEFKAAAAKAPNWPGVYYKWGMWVLKNGDRKTAREKLEKFMSFVPKFRPEEDEAERIWRISNPTVWEVNQILKSFGSQ